MKRWLRVVALAALALTGMTVDALAGPVLVNATSTSLGSQAGRRYRVTNPGIIYNGTTITTAPNGLTITLNYEGGDACASPDVTLGPGQIDDFLIAPGGSVISACSPGGTTYVLVAVQ